MNSVESKNHRFAPPAAFLIWLASQIVALFVSASRLPLWSRSPQNTEQLALVVMLSVQIAISSLIFPHLLNSTRSTILAIVSAWPMAQLASYLADESISVTIRAEAFVSLWLLALYFFTKSLTKPSVKLCFTAAAGLVTLGGPILWYLHADFSDTAASSIPFTNFGPIGAAIGLLISPPVWTGCVSLASAILIGASAKSGFRISRQFIH